MPGPIVARDARLPHEHAGDPGREGAAVPLQVAGQPLEQAEVRAARRAVLPRRGSLGDLFAAGEGLGRELQGNLESLGALDRQLPHQVGVVEAEVVGRVVGRQSRRASGARVRPAGSSVRLSHGPPNCRPPRT